MSNDTEQPALTRETTRLDMPATAVQAARVPVTDPVAVAGFAVSFLSGLAGVVCGIIALTRVRKHGTAGAGFAIAAVVIGGVGMLLELVAALILTILIAVLPGHAVSSFGFPSDDVWAGSYGPYEPEYSAYDYGDDAELDELWDECDEGVLAACDRLYRMAEPGSEYERFGSSCGGTIDPNAYFRFD